jgi:ABC-type antimicrobial peptide transport system permease subunit
VYWNYLQRRQDRMALVVRTDGDARALTPSIIAAIRDVDPEQAVYDVRTMEAVVDRSLAQQWLTTTMLMVLALVSLVIAAVGVYGVVSYGVGQRAREFGVRMALGATRSQVMLMIVRRGSVLIGTGLAIGLAASLVATRALTNLLHDMSAADGISYMMAAAVLALAALWRPSSPHAGR